MSLDSLTKLFSRNNADYVVFPIGSTYYAVPTSESLDSYKGTNPTTVLHSVRDALSSGGSVDLKGAFPLTSTFEPEFNVLWRGSGHGTLIYSSSDIDLIDFTGQSADARQNFFMHGLENMRIQTRKASYTKNLITVNACNRELTLKKLQIMDVVSGSLEQAGNGVYFKATEGSTYFEFNRFKDSQIYGFDVGLKIDASGVADFANHNWFENLLFVKPTTAVQLRATSAGAGYGIRVNYFDKIVVSGESVTTLAFDLNDTGVIFHNWFNRCHAVDFGGGGKLFNIGAGGDHNFLIDCYPLQGATYITDAGTDTIITGKDYERSGTSSIDSGQTTKVVAHGLEATPTKIDIEFREQGTNDYGRWWISDIDGTNFTLNVSADVGASNLDFAWSAKV